MVSVVIAGHEPAPRRRRPWHAQKLSAREPGDRYGTAFSTVVCTENSIRVDYVTETPNVSGDDRPVLPLPDPVVPNNSIRPDLRGEEYSAHYPVRCSRSSIC